jgi:hypothetical protein
LAEKKKETETPPPAPPATPPALDPQVVAAFKASEDRAARAEQRAANAEEMARQAALRASQPSPQQFVDPLIKYSQEDITMSPEDKRRALAAAMDGRAIAAAERVANQQRAERAQERIAIEAQTAINSVTMRRPELSDPKASANFAAAMTKAKYEANALGYEPSPTQLVIAAEKTYDEMFPGAPKPPFTEGPAVGAAAMPMTPDGKPQRSELERTYKMKAGMIKPMYDPGDPAQIDQLNSQYVGARMKGLMERGMNTDYTDIINRAIEEGTEP